MRNFNKFLPLFVFSALQLGALSAKAEKPQWEEYKTADGRIGMRLRMQSQPVGTYSSRSGFEININETSAEVVLENADFRKAVNELKLPDERVDTIISFNIKISMTPYLLGDYTRDRLNGTLDKKLGIVRQVSMEEVRQKVLGALNQNPQYKSLPPEMQKQLFDKTYASAAKQVDQQLRVVREVKASEIDKRLKDIQLETAIQEVAIVVGKVVGNGKAMVFMRLGKFHIENGPSVDENGQSELEALRLGNSRIQRGGGSMGTGAIDLGWVQKLNDNLRLRTDVYLFHSRLPHIDANNDVAQILSMSQNDYDDHLKVWQIDSVGLRTLLQSDKMDIYFGVADHNGKFSMNAGVTIRITPNDTVFIDGYTGNRENLGSGVSVFYAHKLSKHFSVYAGYSHLEDSWEPILSSTPVSYDEVTAGVSYQLLDHETRNGVRIRLKLVAEASKRFYGDGAPFDDEMIYRAGGEVEIAY